MNGIWVTFGGKRIYVYAEKPQTLRIGDTEFQIRFSQGEVFIHRIGQVHEFSESKIKMSSGAAGEPCHCCAGTGRL